MFLARTIFASCLLATLTLAPLAAQTAPASGFHLTSAFASDSVAASFSNSGDVLPHMPTPNAVIRVQPVAPALPTETEHLAHPRLWLALAVSEHASAAFDAWSTRNALSTGQAHEADPLVKPFANSAMVYPALQAPAIGVDFLTRRLMRSNHAVLRNLWWLPQSAATAGSLFCGLQNMRVAADHPAVKVSAQR